MIKKRVFIGMSGGVDSSVSAGLLKKEGYEVVGVFIRVWEPLDYARGKPAGFCSWREERREARRVAAYLDIPLLTLDLSKEYKKRVVDYFIAEYKAGCTPNPDVRCNKYIKFGVFYDYALKNGADYVATGHYAQILKSASKKVDLPSHGHKREFETNSTFFFATSEDTEKDQTYFLWNLRQEQLAKILFPIGRYIKPQVRALAKKFGLPNAEKKDSQGLCFIGQIDFKNFLKRELNEKRGDVLDEQGKIIGHHDGVTFFTLGERHGFTIFTQTPNEKPYYVTAKNIEKNTITVSQNQYQGQSLIKEVKIKKTNWITKTSPDDGLLGAVQRPSSRRLLKARVRYRQPLQKCQIAKINPQKNSATITFTNSQLAVPGQSLVLYDKNICLGGGIIVR